MRQSGDVCETVGTVMASDWGCSCYWWRQSDAELASHFHNFGGWGLSVSQVFWRSIECGESAAMKLVTWTIRRQSYTCHMCVIHHRFIDVSWFLFGSDYKSRGCYRSMPLPCKQDIGGTAKVFQALVEKLEHKAKIQSHGKLVEKASVRQLLCQIADSFQLSALQVSHILPCKVGESLEPLPPDEIISQRCICVWMISWNRQTIPNRHDMHIKLRAMMRMYVLVRT